MAKITLPVDFDPDEYLFLNQDVRKAGVDPVQHYLEHGCGEGRSYKKISMLLRPHLDSPYDFDGLISVHNHDFMESPQFKVPYDRGVKASGSDYQWYWRVHIGLWAAYSAVRVRGDFVECGVNKGFLSSAVMKALDWDATGRTFYLLDTFMGLDERQVSDTERKAGVIERNRRELETGFYTKNFHLIEANFSEWKNKKLIVGSIPDTLHEVSASAIAFLHIDLNCSPPEVAAIESMWDRLVTGGIVLLDDYAYYGYQPQKKGMDVWAEANHVPIASLPTGQGLIIKA